MQDMFTFVRVVEEGSFTNAARSLGMPKSTVSRQVARLEDRLGVRLLHRTTRSLRLSDAGQAYYERARRIVNDIKEAEEAVSSLQTTPRGTLRITAPMQDNQPYLGAIVSSFLTKYPEVQVEVHMTNRLVDMVDEGQRQLNILRNIQEASVTTAVPLTDELRQQILGQMAKVHDGEVDMVEHVDPDILGGYILQLGDQMIDASVKRQLRSLGRELTEHDYEPEF